MRVVSRSIADDVYVREKIVSFVNGGIVNLVSFDQFGAAYRLGKVKIEVQRRTRSWVLFCSVGFW